MKAGDTRLARRHDYTAAPEASIVMASASKQSTQNGNSRPTLYHGTRFSQLWINHESIPVAYVLEGRICGMRIYNELTLHSLSKELQATVVSSV